jgi:uncharacterized RDD family membrane protein YckC
MNTIAYPRLIKRVRAVLIDSVLVPVAVFGTLILGDALGVSQPYGKALLLLGPIFILEPGLVAFTGGTVGHHLQGIRVTRTDGSSNINILAATVRFVVKLLLGWLSFIFVLTTARHQAVHDLVARSMVVHKDLSGLPAHEVLSERALDRATYVYPPAWRRVIVIVGYAVLATVALSIASALVSSAECAHGRQCTTIEVLLAIALDVLWIVGLGWITVRGWNGTLYGCRRHPRESAESLRSSQ